MLELRATSQVQQRLSTMATGSDAYEEGQHRIMLLRCMLSVAG
jgi:hypothetical protein